MRALIASAFMVLLSAGPGRAQPLELDTAQRQWIAAHKTVRVAPDPDLAPIDSVDADGRERGLTADYLKLIAARTGLEFRSVRMATRAEALRALRERRVDIVPGAVAGKDDQTTLYSSPYLHLSAVIYARAGEPGFTNLGQLGGHLVALAEPWPELIAAQVTTLKLQPAPDIANALRSLQDKSVDACIGDPVTIGDALARLKLDQDITLSGQTGVEAALGFAVRSDYAPLRDILDRALQGIGAEADKSIRERWLKTATPVQAVAAPAPPQAAPLPPSNAPAVDTATQALAKAKDLGADQRKQIEDLLRDAQADERSADDLAAQWQALNQSAAGADAAAQKLEESLAVSDTKAMLAWRATLPERAGVEELETLLTAARDSLSTAQASAASLQAEMDRQVQRPAQLRTELAEAQGVLDQSRSATAAAANAALAQAQDLRNRAAERLATIRIALLQLENRTYEPRVRLLAAQLRERQRAVNEAEQHVTVLQNLVLDRAAAVVDDLRARVTREHDEAVAQFRSLNDAATTNVNLVDRLGDSMRTFNQLRAQKQDWDSWLRDTSQALKNTEERIRIGGVSEAVGLILLAEKSKLKPLSQLRRSLATLQTELAQTRIGLIDVREQVEQLGDVGEAVGPALARLPQPPPERLNDLRTAMYRLLNTRAEILPTLLLQQTRLAAADGDAEQVLRELVETTAKLGAILDARLLWTPSHKPVDGAWLARIPADVSRFFGQRRWTRVLTNLASVPGGQPLVALVAAVLVVLFAVRRRVPARLKQIAAPMRRIRTDSYILTGEALFCTFLAALPLPALLWFLGYLCRLVPAGSGNLTEEVGSALMILVPAAFAVSFLRALTLDNGLAQSHFRWPRPRREALRDAAPWLALCVLPTLFVLALVIQRNDPEILDTLGRLALTLALLGVGAIAWWLLAPGRAWTVRDATLQEPVRLRQFARLVATANCVTLAVLVLMGYFVTGLTLGGHTLTSLGALLALATAHGLAVRWLVLGERRLALKRMEQKREADEQREHTEGEPLPEPEPAEITLASVSEQTRRFLRTVTLVAALAILLGIWSEVMPALRLLDTVDVWKEQNVTLLGVLEALVVLALTWVATRNLPGLIELGLLRHIHHIDAATRYAITSVTRYLIVFAGAIAGLSLLGLKWSNLQWLAAGFSVGLGFGMQEIFANFISGLMVLFERPIRVGDTITIGTVEGTVTRIRTRATTIIDGDNREVIVPNKSFITERLINWTLSDSITRLLIKVGIAYRNDPQLAQKLLLEVATAHPLVLEDPPPSCWMTAFGASSQDFELRVCVADIGQRAPVRNDLQVSITEAFREHDIEIAFPQMDLWLRNDVQVHSAAEQKPALPKAASR
jgi:potassium efflux system protein